MRETTISRTRFIANIENFGRKTMKGNKSLLVPIALLAACCALGAVAGEGIETKMAHKQVIALKTSDFELAETDVSDLAIGESKTIVTDSGKTIDLLRTAEGMEIYVDGQQLNTDFPDASELHGTHAQLHKNIEIVCTEEECANNVWISEGDEVHVEVVTTGDAHQIITREVIIECSDDSDCDEHTVRVTADAMMTGLEDAVGEIHVIRLHEDTGTESEGGQRVVKIRKSDHH
jgi:hypothetical protein